MKLDQLATCSVCTATSTRTRVSVLSGGAPSGPRELLLAGAIRTPRCEVCGADRLDLVIIYDDPELDLLVVVQPAEPEASVETTRNILLSDVRVDASSRRFQMAPSLEIVARIIRAVQADSASRHLPGWTLFAGRWAFNTQMALLFAAKLAADLQEAELQMDVCEEIIRQTPTLPYIWQALAAHSVALRKLDEAETYLQECERFEQMSRNCTFEIVQTLSDKPLDYLDRHLHFMSRTEEAIQLVDREIPERNQSELARVEAGGAACGLWLRLLGVASGPNFVGIYSEAYRQLAMAMEWLRPMVAGRESSAATDESDAVGLLAVADAACRRTAKAHYRLDWHEFIEPLEPLRNVDDLDYEGKVRAIAEHTNRAVPDHPQA